MCQGAVQWMPRCCNTTGIDHYMLWLAPCPLAGHLPWKGSRFP